MSIEDTYHCDMCGRDSGIETEPIYNMWVLQDRLGWELSFGYPIRAYCTECKGKMYDIEYRDE